MAALNVLLPAAMRRRLTAAMPRWYRYGSACGCVEDGRRVLVLEEQVGVTVAGREGSKCCARRGMLRTPSTRQRAGGTPRRGKRRGWGLRTANQIAKRSDRSQVETTEKPEELPSSSSRLELDEGSH